MTLVSSIISSALRETNLIAIGASPTANESAEALTRLQSLVLSVLGNEQGENLSNLPLGITGIDVPSGYPWYGDNLPSNTWVPLNTRLVLNLGSDVTVSLHPPPHD